MTNPGEDAGQTASSDSSGAASEPSSGGYEAPPIEQSGAPQQPAEQPGTDHPGYNPPPAYTPPTYEAPSYQPQQGYPGFPPADYPAPTEYPGTTQPGYPPTYPGPAGYGAPSYPPPQYGTPYAAPPGGYGTPPPAGYPPPPGYAPPTGYPAPDYSAYGAPIRKTNQMAITSLVSSLIGFVCWLGSIVGIVLGIVALNQIKQSREEGYGLAIAGIAIGAVSLLVGIIFFVLAFSN